MKALSFEQYVAKYEAHTDGPEGPHYVNMLQETCNNIEEIIEKIGGEENLPAWVQDKIALMYHSADAINTYLDELMTEKKKESKDLKKACWPGYKAVGLKKKGNRMVPNCVPSKNEDVEDDFDFEEVYEGKSSDVERTKGGIVYRDEKFPGFNKPKSYSGPGKFKKRVLAKEGDKIKVLNYGHRDYQDYTQHKDPERRKNFRSRMSCDPVSKLSKLTKRYWACQDLW